MKRKRQFYCKYVKSVMDVLIAGITLIIVSPILLILGIMIRIKLGAPVIFKQKRVGKDGKIFTLYKFRTMTDDRDEKGKLLPDSQRITGFGAKLRSSSLDELPELFNILLRKMSIIGPRPLLVEYLPLYDEALMKRHDVLPGLVGLAGVNGRNNQTWQSKFNYDLSYVEKISFSLDVKIFLKAIIVVLEGKGIHGEAGEFCVDYLMERREKLK